MNKKTKKPNSRYVYLLVVVSLSLLFLCIYRLILKNSQSAKTNNNLSSSIQNQVSNMGEKNWKTYSNDLYNFEISYPSSWTSTKDPVLAGGEYSIFWVAEPPAKGLESARSLLIRQPLAGRIMLKNYLDGEKGTSFVPEFSDSEVTYTNDGDKALIKKCEVLCSYYYYHFVNDSIYNYVVTVLEDDVLANDISGSFKVTENNPLPDYTSKPGGGWIDAIECGIKHKKTSLIKVSLCSDSSPVTCEGSEFKPYDYECYFTYDFKNLIGNTTPASIRIHVFNNYSGGSRREEFKKYYDFSTAENTYIGASEFKAGSNNWLKLSWEDDDGDYYNYSSADVYLTAKGSKLVAVISEGNYGVPFNDSLKMFLSSFEL